MEKELTIHQLLQTKFSLYFYPLKRMKALGTAQQGIVVLDPESKSPQARTLLHELLHVRRPLWSETHILREERRLWKRATWKEKAELFKLLGRAKLAGKYEELENGVVIQAGSEAGETPTPDANRSPGGGAVLQRD